MVTTNPALEARVSSDLNELWRATEPHQSRIAIALLLATAAHLGFALWAPEHAPAAPPAPRAVEVEFAEREPPPPPPPPPVAEPEPPAPTPVRAVAKAAAPPPAAKAAAVMTAAPSAPEPEPSPEAFDFTSDPTSTVFSSGVVAVGGTGTQGLAGAQLGGTGKEPLRAPPKSDGLTPAGDLSQSPRLRNADPCRGFFPAQAQDDVAHALVRVVVGRDGTPSQVSVISESPKGQGFGAAARTCMLEQRFSPALDRKGNPAATAVNVNVRFSR